MKKSEVYGMIIEAVIESQLLELDSKIEALALLFDERGTAMFMESREKDGETA